MGGLGIWVRLKGWGGHWTEERGGITSAYEDDEPTHTYMTDTFDAGYLYNRPTINIYLAIRNATFTTHNTHSPPAAAPPPVHFNQLPSPPYSSAAPTPTPPMKHTHTHMAQTNTNP